MRWLTLALLLVAGCGQPGLEASGMADLITALPNPTPPFSPNDDSADIGLNVEWDPSGSYVSVTGYNDAYDTFFGWYKWDGTTLTKLSDPATAPTGGGGMAWDASSEYLAVCEAAWWGNNDIIRLYKRTGDTLAQVDTKTAPPNSGTRLCLWDGSYLIVGAEFNWTTPWSAGTHHLAVYSRTGDALTLGNTYGDAATNGPVQGMDLHPDGDYLAVTVYLSTGTNRQRVIVYSWDGAGVLAEVANVEADAGEVKACSWDATGVYLATGRHSDSDGNGFELWKWDGGTETLTALSLDSTGLGTYTGMHALWHPTDAYLAVIGYSSAVGEDEQVRIFERSGDTMALTVQGPDVADIGSPWYGAFSPTGGNLAIVQETGNLLYLYSFGGLLVAGNAPQWIPLENRIGCIPASEITPAFSPFDWVEDQTYGTEMVNRFWRPIAGYHDWTLDERLDAGAQLFIHAGQDIAEMVPHFKHDGAGADEDSLEYQLSNAPSLVNAETAWICMENEAITALYLPSLLNGVLLDSTGFKFKLVWDDDTGNGSEHVGAFFSLETHDKKLSADLYFQYVDAGGVTQFTVSTDNSGSEPTFDPTLMRYFRWRYSSVSNTFYLEWATTKDGPWFTVIQLALPQVVPLWGFSLHWASDIRWGTSPDTDRPSSSFISFNPQAGAFAMGFPLNNTVGDIPIRGGTDIAIVLTNEVGDL